MSTDRLLMLIGGISGFLNGIIDLAYHKPTLWVVLNMGWWINGLIMSVLGILSVIGGLLVLYAAFMNPNKPLAILGSILAIIGICGFSVLALIGALMMKE